MSTEQPRISHWPGTLFSFSILCAVLFISRRYITPLCWSGLITIACWPLYKHVKRACRQHDSLAALMMTSAIIAAILVPIAWLILSIAQEALTAKYLLYTYNKTGISAPSWLTNFPLFGNNIATFWNTHLSKPQFIEGGITYLNQYHDYLNNLIQNLGAKTLYHFISFFFFCLGVFFFFKDGETIAHRINTAGERILAEKWRRYMKDTPTAIRSVVNGSILVAIGVGLLMGISYAIAGLPVPALFGLVTAVLALIPFGMVLTLFVVTGVLLMKGSFVSAIVILAWGSIVTFLSDHIIKPSIIGSSTSLPFLMIMIGILGGVETLGLIGLFLGPVIMILFYKLIEEMTK